MLTAGLLISLLLQPLAASAASRPSRRSIRDAARAVDVRNPYMLTINELSLDRTFEDRDSGVKIQYPSMWEMQQVNEYNPPLTLVVIFLSDIESKPNLRQNINLVIEDLPTVLSLPEYTDIGIEMEREFFDDYTLLQSEPMKIAGIYPAQRVRFAASLNGGDTMMFEQVWMLKGKQAHVWTFADSSDMFYKHVGNFHRMLNTVTVR